MDAGKKTQETPSRLRQQVEVLLDNPDTAPFCVIPPRYFELKLQNPDHIEHSPISVERYPDVQDRVVH